VLAAPHQVRATLAPCWRLDLPETSAPGTPMRDLSGKVLPMYNAPT